MEKQDKARETWTEMCSIPTPGIKSSLFGGSDDDEPHEADTDLPAGTKWLVHPHAQKKIQWDLLVAVLIVYSTLSVPFRIGFDQTVGVLGSIIDYVVDIAFLIDIIISFRTAFADEVSRLTSGARGSSGQVAHRGQGAIFMKKMNMKTCGRRDRSAFFSSGGFAVQCAVQDTD